MPAHNSHIHTRTHAPRAGTHTRGTPSLPSLPHNRQQLLGSREQPLPTSGSGVSSSEAELRPSPRRRAPPSRGARGAGVGQLLPLGLSHTGKRCLPPPSTPASERNKRPPSPPPLVHPPLTQPGVFPYSR